jgi:hypothetical protein
MDLLDLTWKSHPRAVFKICKKPRLIWATDPQIQSPLKEGSTQLATSDEECAKPNATTFYQRMLYCYILNKLRESHIESGRTVKQVLNPPKAIFRVSKPDRKRKHFSSKNSLKDKRSRFVRQASGNSTLLSESDVCCPLALGMTNHSCHLSAFQSTKPRSQDFFFKTPERPQPLQFSSLLFSN